MDRLVDDTDSTAEELGDAIYQSSMLIGPAYQCAVNGPPRNVWLTFSPRKPHVTRPSRNNFEASSEPAKI